MLSLSHAPRNYKIIWETVRLIPRGRVATYGEIARESGLPGQARLVGYALHNLPDGIDVPWHRVINSSGRISLPGGSESHRVQRHLLLSEGIRFDGDRIDLEKYGWLRAAAGARSRSRNKRLGSHRSRRV